MAKKAGKEIRVTYTTMKVGTYFNNKDRTPKMIKAKVVYKFTCQSDPDTTYIGRTKRHLGQRIAEHRKGRSVIQTHLMECIMCSNNYADCFTIIDSAKSDFELAVKEAIAIRDHQPSLNKALANCGASYFLNVFP